MVCTGRARCQGTTEAAGGAQLQASTERVIGVAKRTLAPSPARAMRRIRGGFEGQMQRVENGGQRMERDSRVSHASRTIAREPLGSRAFLGALAPLLSDLPCEKRGVRYCMHVQ
jgi:hypothetical protein